MSPKRDLGPGLEGLGPGRSEVPEAAAESSWSIAVTASRAKVCAHLTASGPIPPSLNPIR